MARVENIRALFSSLRIESVIAYLRERGWRLDPQSPPQRLRFEGLASEEGSPYQLWLWASDDHPKFRDRLPNVVFQLAVIEGREPLDVANDMAQSRPRDDVAAAPSPTPQEAQPQRLRIANSHADVNVELVVAGRDLTLRLAPGECVEVLIPPGNAVYELDCRGELFTLRAACAESIRLFHGLPARHRNHPFPTISELVRDSLVAHAGLDQAQRNNLLDVMRPLLKRTEFELAADATGAFAPEPALRQTAVGAAALARHLPDDPSTSACLLGLASILLGRAGLFFEVGNRIAPLLAAIARDDDEHAPASTLELLRHHTTQLPPA